jgi:hypothetical protein
MIRLLWLGLIAGCLLAAPAQAVPPLTPQDFASGLELSLGGAEGLYQLQLPSAVYQGVVRADLADLRVFNGAGETVPFELQRPSAPQPEDWRPLPLFPLPASAEPDSASLRVEIQRDVSGAVIEVRDQTSAASNGPSSYLLDASALQRPLTALEVDWAEPAQLGGSYRVRVDGSDDLQDWRTLAAEQTLLRLQYGGQELVRRRLELPPSRHRYLRLQVAAAGPPWQLTAVRVRLASATEEPARQWLSRTGTALAPAQTEYQFDSGGHFPVDRLQLRLPQPNTIVQASLHSRNRENDPWQRRTTGLFYQLTREGISLTSPELATPLCGDRYWLLRLEQGSLGQGAPELELGWQPHTLTLLARGQGPFLLAFGSGRVTTGEATAGLLSQLAAQTGGSSRPLPAALGGQRTLGGMKALTTSPPADWNTWLLWGCLLLGVLLLAWMAWRLYQQLDRPKTP